MAVKSLFSVPLLMVIAMLLSHETIMEIQAQNPTPAPNTNNTPTGPPTPAPVPACQPVEIKPVNVEVQKYSVTTKKNNTDVTCLVAKFSALIKFNETIVVNGTTTVKTVYLDLGKGVVNTNYSKCDPDTNVLAVDFTCGQLSFNVKHNTSIEVDEIHGMYRFGTPQVETVIHYHDGGLFPVQPGFHYSCHSEQTISMEESKGDLLLSSFELEAFRENNNSDSFFRPIQECALDGKQTNDLVPIAVGACLAALVVIVLIAYFVGRRRMSERSSYESV